MTLDHHQAEAPVFRLRMSRLGFLRIGGYSGRIVGAREAPVFSAETAEEFARRFPGASIELVNC